MSFRGMNWGRLAVGLWMASVMRMPAMASSLKLSYGATAGLVQQLSVAALTTPNWFVTGVENAGNNLEVIAWNNNTAASQVIHRKRGYWIRCINERLRTRIQTGACKGLFVPVPCRRARSGLS